MYQQNNVENAAIEGPPLTQSGLKPQIIQMEWYKGLKTKITIQLDHVESFIKEFAESGTVVQSQEEIICTHHSKKLRTLYKNGKHISNNTAPMRRG